jgi:hypothetical protein
VVALENTVPDSVLENTKKCVLDGVLFKARLEKSVVFLRNSSVNLEHSLNHTPYLE